MEKNMWIKKIKINNFRNYKKEEILLEKNINLFYGENAQGKTNLIEAIYLFTGSKSFRGVKDSHLIKFKCDFARLKADFFSKEREQNAEILIKGRRIATTPPRGTGSCTSF